MLFALQFQFAANASLGQVGHAPATPTLTNGISRKIWQKIMILDNDLKPDPELLQSTLSTELSMESPAEATRTATVPTATVPTVTVQTVTVPTVTIPTVQIPRGVPMTEHTAAARKQLPVTEPKN